MRRKRTVIPAFFLILLGVYLLLNQLGIGIPGWDAVWPVFPFVGGLIILGDYILGRRRDPDRVFLGVAATLVGLAFFFITLGPLEYRDLETWWPVFVLIGGVAFLAQWAAARFRDWSALFLALVAFVVGGAGLAITFQLLGPQTRELLPRLWPVLLILGGLMALLRGLIGRRRE
jgi:drug/metabolite transporter (DMT)-like permease